MLTHLYEVHFYKLTEAVVLYNTDVAICAVNLATCIVILRNSNSAKYPVIIF